MNIKRWAPVILLSLLVLCIVIVFFAIVGGRKKSSSLTLYGNVDVRLVDLGFRVPGQVETIFFEEGDFVEEGALFGVLDKTPYDAKVLQAQAGVDAIAAQLVNAEILLQRRKDLIVVGGVSQENVDDALARRDKLAAELVLAKATLAVALDDLSYTQGTIPTKGVILTRIREPGSVVNASDPVYTLSVSSPVWVRAYVDEPDLGKIAYGMSAEVYTDLKDGPVYTGKIGFISPMAEFTPKTVQTAQLRTDLVYRLRIYVDNPDNILKQGMPVTVKVPLQKRMHRD